MDNAFLLDGIINDDDGKQRGVGGVVVDKLVDAALYYNLDGWLINIEAKLPSPSHVTKMKAWLENLTRKMAEVC